MEKIYSLQLGEISPLIEKLSFDAADYMIIEKVDAIKIENFTPLSFEEWEKGTIFSSTKQFKWRKLENKFHVIYSGDDVVLNDQESFVETNTENDSVILWGWRSDKMLDFSPNEYIEFQIPKTLSYPVESHFRVRLKFKIQKNQNKEIIGYRFMELCEEKRNESL